MLPSHKIRCSGSSSNVKRNRESSELASREKLSSTSLRQPPRRRPPPPLPPRRHHQGRQQRQRQQKARTRSPRPPHTSSTAASATRTRRRAARTLLSPWPRCRHRRHRKSLDRLPLAEPAARPRGCWDRASGLEGHTHQRCCPCHHALCRISGS